MGVRRYYLTHQLWNLRLRVGNGAQSEHSTPPAFFICYSANSGDERELYQEFKHLMKCVRCEDLKSLREVIKSGDDFFGGCLCLHRAAEFSNDSPVYLMAKLFRWPNISSDARLKPLPWCSAFSADANSARSHAVDDEPIKTAGKCCNPFHYALWIPAEIGTHLATRLHDLALIYFILFFNIVYYFFF